ncbi:MAG: glycosyltransferase family 2 protein [Kutzneria sp.]|nr:glycosyltransferase family 2 protein [Kutzneria sp.]
MAKVSICIPVYNRAEQLDRALRSAIGQTYSDLDIIVLDNASTDASLEVARSHAAHDPRVRVERNDTTLDKAANWRRCLSFARGEYVKLLFSDDWISEEAIERAVRVLDARPDIGFVYTAMSWTEHGSTNTCYTADSDEDMASVDFLYRSATIADLVPVSTSCVVVRTSDAVTLFEERIPARLSRDTHHIGVGYSAILLWRCCDRYPAVHHIGAVLAHSAEATSGELNSRTRYRDQYETLWWGYRNAFAHFLSGCGQPDEVLRGLMTTVVVSTVPLRPYGARKRLRRLRLLFPELRMLALRPFQARVRPFLAHRLLHPPDPVEILGPSTPSRTRAVRASRGAAR